MNIKRPIVVEGPDGAGKSTLCRDLGYVFRMDVFHTGGPIKSEADGVERAKRMKDAGVVIFDRVPQISERVYGPFRPDGVTYEVPMSTLTELNPIIILCQSSPVPDLEAWMKAQQGKKHKSPEHARMVWERQKEIQHTYVYEVPSWIPLTMEVLDYRFQNPNALGKLVRCICDSERLYSEVS